ncbi:MAG: hypothetical protein CL912_12615 [Deltaproteobacteria bacterium]|nr:hypothetical protein [Deltaproteobacteria bacterium]
MSTVLILGCKDTQKENGDEGWKEKGEKLRDVSSTGRYAWHAWKQRHVELGMLGHFARYLYAVLAQHFWPWGGYFFFLFFVLYISIYWRWRRFLLSTWIFWKGLS